MSRNIVKDYILHDKECIHDYLATIATTNVDEKLIDTIVDTYVDVRYYDLYDHINGSMMETLEHYIRLNTENILKKNEKKLSDTKIKRNVNLSLWLIKYILYFEKATTDRKISKLLEDLEIELKRKFTDVPNNLKDELFILIKSNVEIKKKCLRRMKCNDFILCLAKTNLTNVYDVVLNSEVKVPDLFSEVAVKRVYNTGIIAEDKMSVLFTLISVLVLNNILEYNYNNYYLIEFNSKLFGKKNKIGNLLKIVDLDLLKDKLNFKITYEEFEDNKDHVYEYIRNGYKFAVVLNDDNANKQLLDVFSYVIINEDMATDGYESEKLIIR